MSKPVKEQPDVVKRIADLEKDNKEKQRKIEQLESQLGEANDFISRLSEHLLLKLKRRKSDV